MDFFSDSKGSDTFLLGNLICLIRQLRNGVLLSLFACFQDGRQNHTESYIVVDSLFYVPRNICKGFLCWSSVFYYASLCVHLFLLTP